MKEITEDEHAMLHRMYFSENIKDSRLELYFALNSALVCEASTLLTKKSESEIYHAKTYIGRLIINHPYAEKGRSV